MSVEAVNSACPKRFDGDCRGRDSSSRGSEGCRWLINTHTLTQTAACLPINIRDYARQPRPAPLTNTMPSELNFAFDKTRAPNL